MAILFTADTHFSHRRIIQHCNRPFSSTDEMDAVMIERWNALVAPTDTVYHLGDFCWKGKASRYRNRLNGIIHLIRGNHDKNIGSADFASVSDICTVKVDDVEIVLCHYPLAEWEGYYGSTWHFHGHAHGTLKSKQLRRIDVGVDQWGFQPITQRLKGGQLKWC